MSTNNLTKENIFKNIDFKELAKTHKTEDDLTTLTILAFYYNRT